MRWRAGFLRTRRVSASSARSQTEDWWGERRREWKERGKEGRSRTGSLKDPKQLREKPNGESKDGLSRDGSGRQDEEQEASDSPARRCRNPNVAFRQEEETLNHPGKNAQEKITHGSTPGVEDLRADGYWIH